MGAGKNYFKEGPGQERVDQFLREGLWPWMQLGIGNPFFFQKKK